MAAGGMRLSWSLLACGAVLSSWRLAGAAPLLVEWTAPACAQEPAFRARVRDALRREPESALERELRVHVTIRENPENTGYLLQVSTDAGARQLEVPTCDEAVAAAATVVALTIDPNAAPEAEDEPEATSPASPQPESNPAPPPTQPESAPRPGPVAPAAGLEPYVAAFGGVSLGDVPALSPLVGGGAGLRVGRLGVGVEGLWVASQTELLPDTDKGGAIGLWGGRGFGLLPAARRRAAAERLPGCAGWGVAFPRRRGHEPGRAERLVGGGRGAARSRGAAGFVAQALSGRRRGRSRSATVFQARGAGAGFSAESRGGTLFGRGRAGPLSPSTGAGPFS